MFFFPISYIYLCLTFALVLCLIHPVSLSFILALYFSKTLPWSYHYLLGFCSVLKLLYLDFVFVNYLIIIFQYSFAFLLLANFSCTDKVCLECCIKVGTINGVSTDSLAHCTF